MCSLWYNVREHLYPELYPRSWLPVVVTTPTPLARSSAATIRRSRRAYITPLDAPLRGKTVCTSTVLPRLIHCFRRLLSGCQCVHCTRASEIISTPGFQHCQNTPITRAIPHATQADKLGRQVVQSTQLRLLASGAYCGCLSALSVPFQSALSAYKVRLSLGCQFGPSAAPGASEPRWDYKILTNRIDI